MPHHPEGLTAWILQVQGMMMGNGGAPDAHSEAPSRGGPAPDAYSETPSRGGYGGPAQQGGYAPSRPDTSSMTTDQAAYSDASAGARANRERNRGGGIF